MSQPFQIRQPCPPSACNCGRELLLSATTANPAILRLTLMEERKLVERLENPKDLADLEHLQQKMHEQLGIRMRILPNPGEVRSARGIRILIEKQPGLCRKTRQALPAAIRRGLTHNPEILYRLLDAHDLLGGTGGLFMPDQSAG